MTAITQHSAVGISYLRCDGGGGIPVVLLHGIGSNAHSFEPLMAALDSRHYPTLAWHAPGYGDSQLLPVGWPDASDYAAALKRLLAHLEISRCVLVGHSLGCLVAARYAIVAPAQIAALFLISPALGYRAKKGDLIPFKVGERIEELDRLGAKKFAAKRAPALLADPSARPEVLQAVERAMAAVNRSGHFQAALLLASGRLLDDAANIEVPAAVIRGGNDRVTPPENGHFVFAALQASSPRRGFRIIENAGHAICQEQPAEVAQTIVQFIEAKADAHA
jgi:pimeloyl-ACP methyl ester carboxylesterase